MVARAVHSPPHREAPSGLAAAVMLRWRMFLTRLAHGAGELGTAAATGVRSTIALGVLLDIESLPVVVLAAAALLAGAVGGTLIAPSGARTAAALAGAASFLWTALRWLVLRVTEPRLAASDPNGVRGAFAAGLLVYALAVTPGLRLAAWLASAVITAVVLLRRGAGRSAVLSGVGLAWGAQAFVVCGMWFARNAYVALVAMRG